MWILLEPERRGASGRLRRLLQGAAVAALVAGTCGLSISARAESLHEALTSAYRYNPKLDAERALQRANDEDVVRAESGYRPVVQGTVDAGRQRLASTPAYAANGYSSPWGYTLTAKQSVFNGFRTVNGVAQAEASVKAGQENLRQAEAGILIDAATAYLDVARDIEILRIRENNVKVLAKDLEAAQTRRNVREVTKTDVAQARARHARAISAADLARANLKISRASYERVIGHPAAGIAFPSLKLKLLPRRVEDAWALAEKENPAVNAALAQEEAARYNVDVVRGELLPEVHIEASYDDHQDVNNLYSDQSSASVTGRMTMPLYDGGEVRARVRQAKETHVARLQQIEQARTETQANVTAAWSKLLAARASFKSNSIQVDANKLALEGVREEEKVGQRTLLDVLNAEQEYLDAQIQLVSDRHDQILASYQVLAVIGALNAQTLRLGDEYYDPHVHLSESRDNWFGIDITRADGRRERFEAADPEGTAGEIVE